LRRLHQRPPKIFRSPPLPPRTHPPPNSSPFSFPHVTRPASRRAIKQFFASRCIPRFRTRFFLYAANIRHHLPDLFVRHSHANSSIGRGGHRRSCNSVVYVVENLFVRIAVPFRAR